MIIVKSFIHSVYTYSVSTICQGFKQAELCPHKSYVSVLCPKTQDVTIFCRLDLKEVIKLKFREGDGTPLQYPCLENPMEEEPGRLQSIGSWRVGHNRATSLSLFTFTHWSRKWQPTPVFLPGESQGRGSLVGCRLWGCTESDTTEAT